MEFLEGYLLGLGMILFIGPVFFLLLSISLQMGTNAGVLAAIGIIISDIACVSICYYWIDLFLYKDSAKFWLLLVGGSLLILLGLKYLLKSSNPSEENTRLPPLHYFTCFLKGFLVNFVNPFVFFVWIGVVAYAKEIAASGNNSYIYLGGVLAAILSTDLLKVFTAAKIKSFLKQNSLKYFYRVSGLILIGFGIRMLVLLV
jgi:threonine/homoserine/homoserine lactone efflux protein